MGELPMRYRHETRGAVNSTFFAGPARYKERRIMTFDSLIATETVSFRPTCVRSIDSAIVMRHGVRQQKFGLSEVPPNRPKGRSFRLLAGDELAVAQRLAQPMVDLTTAKLDQPSCTPRPDQVSRSGNRRDPGPRAAALAVQAWELGR